MGEVEPVADSVPSDAVASRGNGIPFCACWSVFFDIYINKRISIRRKTIYHLVPKRDDAAIIYDDDPINNVKRTSGKCVGW